MEVPQLKDIGSSCSTVVSACESLEFSCLPQGERASCDMCSARLRLRPWLEDKINSGKIPGLCWRDKEKKEFRVSVEARWQNLISIMRRTLCCSSFGLNIQASIITANLRIRQLGRTRFRCALHKMPDVVEVRVPHSLDEKDPYRVFRFTKKGKLMDGVNSVTYVLNLVPTNQQRFPVFPLYFNEA